jgi:short-subunit dehydrogenase
MNLRDRYGEWAVVVGGSTGVGSGMAAEAASRGMNVLLTARRAAVLDDAAQDVRDRFGVEVRTMSCDIAAPDFREQIATATDGLEVGLLAFNAAVLVGGVPFLKRSLEDHLESIQGNCAGVTALCYDLGGKMVERGRGCIILISSLGAIQGAKLLSSYVATKAFQWILAESLWAEFGEHGVDVLGVLLGATLTPHFLDDLGPRPTQLAPDEVEVDDVLATLVNRMINATDPRDAAARIFAQLDAGPTIYSDPVDGRAADKLLRLRRADAVNAMSGNTTSAGFAE